MTWRAMPRDRTPPIYRVLDVEGTWVYCFRCRVVFLALRIADHERANRDRHPA